MIERYHSKKIRRGEEYAWIIHVSKWTKILEGKALTRGLNVTYFITFHNISKGGRRRMIFAKRIMGTIL